MDKRDTHNTRNPPMISLYLLLLPLLLAFAIWRYYQWVAKYPRGPRPLPFIGNLLQLSASRLHDELPELAKEYGNVFTVFLPVPMVVLADYEAVKEAMIDKGDDFAGRPDFPAQEELFFTKNPGVIRSNGASWRENRRSAIHILRDFGMGKNLMEEQVKLSVEEYLRCLRDIKDKSRVDMRWPIQLMVANIINETLFGYRYKYDDCAPLIDYVENFNKFINSISTSLLRFAVISVPWIVKLPILRTVVLEKRLSTMRKLNRYITDNVARALENYSPDMEPECFVHAYSQRMGTSEYLIQEQMYAVCADFFLAGQETTTTTLRWAMLLLAANPRVQTKLREEVLSVVGRDRLPSMADKPLMPYTSATVLELQRRANIVQTSVVRYTLEDTQVMGHNIPAGTLINGDIHIVMAHDPVFERPEEFRPERYLSDDGKTLNKARPLSSSLKQQLIQEAVERTIPFGLGKRQCAGEGLAKVELFIGLAATVQNYRVEAPSGIPVDLSPQALVIMLPKPQSLTLVPLHY